ELARAAGAALSVPARRPCMLSWASDVSSIRTRVSSTLDEGDVAAVHPARTRAAISSRLRKGIWFPPVGSTGHAQVDNIASPPRAVEPPADPYSARSATTGSTSDARRAGIQLAASATPTSNAIAG